MTEPIGIVAIGRNEGERLVACLTSLDLAKYPVVYVDSASTDGSAVFARRLGIIVVDLDMATPFTAARARNAGYSALMAAHPAIQFVQFVDGDCLIAPSWIETARRFADDHSDVAVVCGRRRERSPSASIYNRLADLEWNTPVGEAVACGGDALVRVSAFDKVGGYDGALMAGEEPELCARLATAGWRIWRLDAEMTLHDAAMFRLGQWWMRGVRSGFGYAQVWTATHRKTAPLYRREMLRAIFWAGFIPAAAILGAIAIPAAILMAPIAFAAQIGRMAISRGAKPLDWQCAFYTMLAKFPELQGGLRYLMAGRRARPSIAYK